MSSPFDRPQFVIGSMKGREPMKFPTCARCQKEVEKVTVGDNPITDEIVFTVECHGATELVAIAASLLASCETVEFGEAFRGD